MGRPDSIAPGPCCRSTWSPQFRRTPGLCPRSRTPGDEVELDREVGRQHLGQGDEKTPKRLVARSIRTPSRSTTSILPPVGCNCAFDDRRGGHREAQQQEDLAGPGDEGSLRRRRTCPDEHQTESHATASHSEPASSSGNAKLGEMHGAHPFVRTPQGNPQEPAPDELSAGRSRSACRWYRA